MPRTIGASIAFAMSTMVYWHLHDRSVLPGNRFWTIFQYARKTGTNSNCMGSRPGLRMPGLRENWRSDNRAWTSGRFLDLDRVRATTNSSRISILAPRVRTRVRHTIVAIERRFAPVALSVPPPFEKQLPEYLKVHGMVDMHFTTTHSSIRANRGPATSTAT
jgi:hypothetical protein